MAVIFFDRECEACQQSTRDLSDQMHEWIHAVLSDRRAALADAQDAIKQAQEARRAADDFSEGDSESIYAALNRLEDAIEDIRFTLDNAGKD